MSENQSETQELTQQDKTLGMLCHLLGLAGYVFWLFGNILGPLILWLVKKDTSKFVDDQGKESLNFQISITIYAVGASILSLLLIGLPLLLAIGVFDIVMIILAAVQANNGVRYRYPLCIRFIK